MGNGWRFISLCLNNDDEGSILRQEGKSWNQWSFRLSSDLRRVVGIKGSVFDPLAGWVVGLIIVDHPWMGGWVEGWRERPENLKGRASEQAKPGEMGKRKASERSSE